MIRLMFSLVSLLMVASGCVKSDEILRTLPLPWSAKKLYVHKDELYFVKSVHGFSSPDIYKLSKEGFITIFMPTDYDVMSTSASFSYAFTSDSKLGVFCVIPNRIQKYSLDLYTNVYRKSEWTSSFPEAEILQKYQGQIIHGKAMLASIKENFVMVSFILYPEYIKSGNITSEPSYMQTDEIVVYPENTKIIESESTINNNNIESNTEKSKSAEKSFLILINGESGKPKKIIDAETIRTKDRPEGMHFNRPVAMHVADNHLIYLGIGNTIFIADIGKDIYESIFLDKSIVAVSGYGTDIYIALSDTDNNLVEIYHMTTQSDNKQKALTIQNKRHYIGNNFFSMAVSKDSIFFSFDDDNNIYIITRKNINKKPIIVDST